MVVARASGTLMASSLTRSTFFYFRVVPRAPPYGRSCNEPGFVHFWPTRPKSTQNTVRRATKKSRGEPGFVYFWARVNRTNFL